MNGRRHTNVTMRLLGMEMGGSAKGDYDEEANNKRWAEEEVCDRGEPVGDNTAARLVEEGED
jgi:hypothetical protein